MKYLVSLKNELSLFLLVVLIAALLVGSVYLYRESLHEDRVLAEARLKTIQKKFQTAQDHQRLMEEYRQKFELLKNKNIIGEENRLDWIDRLDRIIKQAQIPYVKYRINQQRQSTDRELLSRFPNIAIYQSPMELEMMLLHEGDLYTLINSLDHNAKGLFEIEQCTIQRAKITQINMVGSRTDSNLKAKCTLNWYSFRLQDS